MQRQQYSRRAGAALPGLHVCWFKSLSALTSDSVCLSRADAFQGSDHIRFPTRVVAKGPGWIQLERPLPYDIRTRWQARCSRDPLLCKGAGGGGRARLRPSFSQPAAV